MSRASSLAFMVPSRDSSCPVPGSGLRSRRRAPSLDPTLDQLHELDQYHADGDDGEHPDEHLVGLKARAGLTDHCADAGGGAIDLADHDPDHATPDREAKPRQQEGNRARQDDGPKEPPLAGAEARREPNE